MGIRPAAFFVEFLNELHSPLITVAQACFVVFLITQKVPTLLVPSCPPPPPPAAPPPSLPHGPPTMSSMVALMKATNLEETTTLIPWFLQDVSMVMGACTLMGVSSVLRRLGLPWLGSGEWRWRSWRRNRHGREGRRVEEEGEEGEEGPKLLVSRGQNRTPSRMDMADVMEGDVVRLTSTVVVPGDGVFIEGRILISMYESYSGKFIRAAIIDADIQIKYPLAAGSVVWDGHGKMLVRRPSPEARLRHLYSTETWARSITLDDHFKKTSDEVHQSALIGALIVSSIHLFRVLVSDIFRLFISSTSPREGDGGYGGGYGGGGGRGGGWWCTTGRGRWSWAREVRDLGQVSEMASNAISIATPSMLMAMAPIATYRMCTHLAKKKGKVSIWRMDACDYIASVTSICLKMTGVITTGEMVVTEAVMGDPSNIITRSDFLATSTRKGMHASLIDLLLESIVQNTSGDVVEREGEAMEVVGAAPLEKGLLQFGMEIGGPGSFRATKRLHERVRIEPFCHVAKKMGVALVLSPHSRRVIWKGDWEVMLPLCDTWLAADGDKRPLSWQTRWRLQATAASMGQRGRRVIMYAFADLCKSHFPHLNLDDVTGGGEGGERGGGKKLYCEKLVCLAMVGLNEPVKDDVADAIESLRQAGVRPRMCTSASLAMASAKARQCGLLGERGVAINGEDLYKMENEELREVVKTVEVLANANLAHQHFFMDLLQHSGEVVAVTGDCARDSLTLSKSDVGISIGTPCAQLRRVAHAGLMDGNLCDIVEMVRWGRALHANTCKFMEHRKGMIWVALGACMVSMCMRGKPAFSSAQLICANTFFGILGALSYGLESPKNGVIEPQPVKQAGYSMLRSFSCENWTHIGFEIAILSIVRLCWKGLFQILGLPASDTKEDAVVFTAFLLFQVFDLWKLKGRKDFTFLVTMVCALASYRAAAKYMSAVFNWEMMSVQEWIFCFGIVTFGCVLEPAAKFFTSFLLPG